MEREASVTYSANPHHYGLWKMECGPKKKKKRETHAALKVS